MIRAKFGGKKMHVDIIYVHLTRQSDIVQAFSKVMPRLVATNPRMSTLTPVLTVHWSKKVLLHEPSELRELVKILRSQDGSSNPYDDEGRMLELHGRCWQS